MWLIYAVLLKNLVSLIEVVLSFVEVNLHVKSLKVKGRQFFFHLAGFSVIAVSLTEVLLYLQRTDFGDHSALSTGGGGGIFSMFFLTPRQHFFTKVPPLSPKCKVRCFYHQDQMRDM